MDNPGDFKTGFDQRRKIPSCVGRKRRFPGIRPLPKAGRRYGTWKKHPVSAASMENLKKGMKKKGEGGPIPVKGYRQWHTILKDLLIGNKDVIDYFEKTTGIKLPPNVSRLELQNIIGGVLIARALKDDLGAIDMLMNRTDGKLPQTIDLQSPDTIPIAEIPPELRKELLEKEIKKLEAKHGKSSPGNTEKADN